ncbi:unnamed protein product [Symbiodinium necroappetens]|uniref:Uncharacterized protein n=1 Tax=Symbiodinium necroappetens TaxID=1628268 RepID=A0A812LME2_9DINO|nr:unnamed protein product [Symbiodinium necroappetens]
MSRHLQTYIWSECVYTLENVKNGRWHLGSTGKYTNADGIWKDIMAVNRQKQTFFIQRLHFAFQIKRKQVRTATTARLSPEGWESLVDSSCLLMWVLDAMSKARTDDGADVLFTPDTLRAATQKVLEGDYNTEAEKFCMLKLADIKPQDLNLWTDHLGTAAPASLIKLGMEEVTKLDNESIQKQFESDVYKISLDLTAFLAHLAELQKCGRSKQMAKVCHLRAENKRGSSLVLDFMEVNSRHTHGLYKDADVLEDVKKAW